MISVPPGEEARRGQIFNGELSMAVRRCLEFKKKKKKKLAGVYTPLCPAS